MSIWEMLTFEAYKSITNASPFAISIIITTQNWHKHREHMLPIPTACDLLYVEGVGTRLNPNYWLPFQSVSIAHFAAGL